MKKIRLDLEQLAVDSFATERDGGAEKGTVRGHDSGGSGIGCISMGCDSVSGLEMCACEDNLNPVTSRQACG